MIYTKWAAGSHSEERLKVALDIREEVFIKEQQVDPAIERDNYDKIADHIVVYESDIPVATGRLVYKDSHYVIGRVAVLEKHRGKSYGDLVVRMLVRRAFDRGAEAVYLHSQVQVKGFYEKLGFAVVGEPFEEAGMEHVEMVRTTDVRGCCNH